MTYIEQLVTTAVVCAPILGLLLWGMWAPSPKRDK